jgi:hypothetical protein
LIKICDENQYQKTVDLSARKNSKKGKNSNLREVNSRTVELESLLATRGRCGGRATAAAAAAARAMHNTVSEADHDVGDDYQSVMTMMMMMMMMSALSE